MTLRKQSAGKTRKNPQQLRSRATFDVLLEATARFLAEEGLSRLSTNRVAERAGVSIGTLYQYFPSKEALLVAVAQRQFAADLAMVREILEEQNFTALEDGVIAIVRSAIRLFREQTELRLLISEQSRSLSLLDARSAFQAEIRALLLRNFERFSQGRFATPSELEMFTLVSAAVGALTAAASEKREYLETPAFEDQIVRLIIGSYRPLA